MFEHEVIVVSSIEAAQKMLEQIFDAVLVDYDLDDGKGDALVRELSQRNQRPKIVAVSSHQPGNTALLAAGADAVCDKMNFAKIVSVLDTLL